MAALLAPPPPPAPRNNPINEYALSLGPRPSLFSEVNYNRLLRSVTHYATSCSNTSRRHISPCVQARRLVAATQRGDTSQQQIASCVLENFRENLRLRNKILSLQHVAKNQIRLNLCDLLRRQNSVAAKKIFTNIL